MAFRKRRASRAGGYRAGRSASRSGKRRVSRRASGRRRAAAPRTIKIVVQAAAPGLPMAAANSIGDKSVSPLRARF